MSLSVTSCVTRAAGTRRGSAGAVGTNTADGALLPTLSVLPVSKAPPRVSPSRGTRIGPCCAVQPRRDQRRVWCLPADHFIPEALGIPVSLEERPSLGRSLERGDTPRKGILPCSLKGRNGNLHATQGYSSRSQVLYIRCHLILQQLQEISFTNKQNEVSARLCGLSKITLLT